jgi:argininosuccinate synthase
MTQRIVLAYSGSVASSAAVGWLAAAHAAEVVTVTLDVGQSEDLAALRARALSGRAVRAHVVDARDEFARDHVLPHLQTGVLDVASLVPHIARPLIARTLLEIAAIEGATAVAHVTAEDTAEFDGIIGRLDPSVRVIAAAREWQRAGSVPVPAKAAPAWVIEQNLCGRLVTWTAGPRSSSPAGVYRLTTDRGAAPDQEAYVDLTFGNGVPLTINRVPMSVTELVESLSTIAGRHGVGRTEQSASRRGGLTCRRACEAPAATVLHMAYSARRQGADEVRLKLFKGEATVVASYDRDRELVSHP